MALETYRKKRKFKETPEPEGKVAKTGKKIFVIQKHAARSLHYDFRLEVAGVLKSWAVPKVIPKKGEKHLAVETEDHPIEYAKFKGIIPEGNYGAGKVIIWDKGKFENLSELSLKDSYKKGHIKINLKGKKAKGEYDIIHTKFGRNEKNWLLIKK